MLSEDVVHVVFAFCVWWIYELIFWILRGLQNVNQSLLFKYLSVKFAVALFVRRLLIYEFPSLFPAKDAVFGILISFEYTNKTGVYIKGFSSSS